MKICQRQPNRIHFSYWVRVRLRALSCREGSSKQKPQEQPQRRKSHRARNTLRCYESLCLVTGLDSLHDSLSASLPGSVGVALPIPVWLCQKGCTKTHSHTHTLAKMITTCGFCAHHKTPQIGLTSVKSFRLVRENIIGMCFADTIDSCRRHAPICQGANICIHCEKPERERERKKLLWLCISQTKWWKPKGKLREVSKAETDCL